ncbi:LOB domain-containing protein 25 [Euphorbia peplus]|nr:LOB domain-containing protein 25 [Euphorbia peplus]
MNEARENTSQACAACKYRRRKCTKDCIYAPYFPAHHPKSFLDAHRLFGVSNIKRILMQVKDEERDDAMKSVIYESSIRAQFPVHGCRGLTCLLESQIQQVTQELSHVKRLLEVCKKLEMKNEDFDFCNTNNETIVPAEYFDSVQQ